MTVDDQLRQAFSALDSQVRDHVRAQHLALPGAHQSSGPASTAVARRGGRRRPWLGPAIGGLATLLVVVSVVIGARAAHDGPARRPVPTHTTAPPKAPSQSPADAARDDILSAVAALPLSARVHLVTPSHDTEITTGQGIWVLSSLDPSTLGHCLGPDGAPGRRYRICNPYGELLLLSVDRRQILRAYPMPLPAQWLVAGPQGLYAGRAGDGAYVDSTICRVATATMQLTCRDYPLRGGPDGPTYTARQLAPWPGHWVVDAHRTAPAMQSAKIVGDALVVSSPHQPSTRLDPITLAELP